jgi:hypothetical protein
VAVDWNLDRYSSDEIVVTMSCVTVHIQQSAFVSLSSVLVVMDNAIALLVACCFEYQKSGDEAGSVLIISSLSLIFLVDERSCSLGTGKQGGALWSALQLVYCGI